MCVCAFERQPVHIFCVASYDLRPFGKSAERAHQSNTECHGIAFALPSSGPAHQANHGQDIRAESASFCLLLPDCTRHLQQLWQPRAYKHWSEKLHYFLNLASNGNSSKRKLSLFLSAGWLWQRTKLCSSAYCNDRSLEFTRLGGVWWCGVWHRGLDSDFTLPVWRPSSQLKG